jgi:hypothetical protein
MIALGAAAVFPVDGANSVAELRDLYRCPMALMERGDQAGDYAGFADAARVAADNDDGHTDSFRFRVWSFKLRRFGGPFDSLCSLMAG